MPGTVYFAYADRDLSDSLYLPHFFLPRLLLIISLLDVVIYTADVSLS